MASQSAKELVEELDKHRIEVSKLRNTLNVIDKEKEAWFKKKEELSAKIRESIKKIKDNKDKRDALTQEVKELKPKRDSINKEINAKLKDLDNLKKEKSTLSKSLDVKESPSRIKQHIEKLEFRIETEAMPFDKEQALMKKIKELKNLYDDASIILEADKKIKDNNELIKKMRKDANEMHELIQEKANQSQILHEEILELYPEIDKIKIEEAGAFKKFSELKKKFNEANSQLKGKLKVMNYVKNALHRISSDKREKKRQEVESFLKSKEEAVNEKFRKGQKLTTEDLLVFQKFDK